ncbi:holin [Xanthomonas phage RiverRider]|uniref:Holin n=1 Tax=Xanthomonas phage RiverRider TaxID=2108116 RepID=A0A2P1JV19_9CAUD|nr:holin [Xanthomonas phage RiverRider]AVO23163.1 holin [Xanthomonas phage RiverRider]
MIKLIPNWKKSWKFSSIWYMGGAFVLNIADFIVSNVPLGSINKIPHGKSITIVLLGMAMIARVLKFKGSSDGSETE